MNKTIAAALFLFVSMTAERSPSAENSQDRRSLMTTADVIHGYFEALENGKAWDSFFADRVVFTSFTSPVKEIQGKSAFLQGTRRFYSTIATVVVRDVIVQGDQACALTRYGLQPPGKERFTSDVAEIFKVEDGKIVSFGIYFDTAPFPK